MKDPHVGISLRFIREWKPEPATLQVDEHDLAFSMAVFPANDDDMRTFPERLADAYAFLRERQRHLH